MRRPSPYRDRGPLQVAMTPMIDVVFLLLIFFLWTASFQIVEYALPSSISPPSNLGSSAERELEIEDFEQIVVRITGEPGNLTYAVNERRTQELPEVREILGVLASIKNDVPLIIDPVEAVPVGQVIDVYDIGRVLNFQEIQFAVEPDQKTTTDGHKFNDRTNRQDKQETKTNELLTLKGRWKIARGVSPW